MPKKNRNRQQDPAVAACRTASGPVGSWRSFLSRRLSSRHHRDHQHGRRQAETTAPRTRGGGPGSACSPARRGRARRGQHHHPGIARAVGSTAARVAPAARQAQRPRDLRHVQTCRQPATLAPRPPPHRPAPARSRAAAPASRAPAGHRPRATEHRQVALAIQRPPAGIDQHRLARRRRQQDAIHVRTPARPARCWLSSPQRGVGDAPPPARSSRMPRAAPVSEASSRAADGAIQRVAGGGEHRFLLVHPRQLPTAGGRERQHRRQRQQPADRACRRVTPATRGLR